MSRSRPFVLLAGLVLVVTVSGCAKKAPAPAPPPPPPPPTAPAPPPPPPPPPPPAPAPAPAPLTEEQLFARMSNEEVASKYFSDVFFAFDSSELSEAARGVLDKNAQSMKRWSSIRISVEGHCDNRGTAEYNLGLGERRAKAVRDYLATLGVGGDRISTVSKGKETPFCSEDTEACWSQNRRGHFVVTAK